MAESVAILRRFTVIHKQEELIPGAWKIIRGVPPVLYGDALFSITYKWEFVRESFIFNKLAKKRSAASACFAFPVLRPPIDKPSICRSLI